MLIMDAWFFLVCVVVEGFFVFWVFCFLVVGVYFFVLSVWVLLGWDLVFL